ncbi:MAG TPA: response regulator transcription factor, partial [Planctomycetes bacterium]|nr:response regulator transcription factor [Planctomycetota bacterium]
MTAEPTVFAVDPDGQVCYSIRRLAAMMNLPCETYNSGTQFLDCYDRSRAGCLVLEVKIPDIAGLEMQKRLASEEPSPPVIFLTGHASVSIAVRAMRAGAVHFFEKPLREDELWDAIREAMELDQQRRCAWAQQQELQRRLAQLTPKELRVLELIAEGKTKRSI